MSEDRPKTEKVDLAKSSQTKRYFLIEVNNGFIIRRPEPYKFTSNRNHTLLIKPPRIECIQRRFEAQRAIAELHYLSICK